jgi:hypothetical protein
MEDEIEDGVTIKTNVPVKEFLVDALINLGMLLLGIVLSKIF